MFPSAENKHLSCDLLLKTCVSMAFVMSHLSFLCEILNIYVRTEEKVAISPSTASNIVETIIKWKVNSRN